MRENKFRGISERTGQFAYGGLVRANSEQGNYWAIKDTIYNINNGIINIIPEIVNPETVGQYTESEDKKGDQVYEGDIWKRGGFIAVVTFEFAGWHLPKAESSDSYQYPSFYSNAKTGEIIGNIHENPELLK